MGRKHGRAASVTPTVPPSRPVTEALPEPVAPPPAKAEGVTVKNVTKTWFRQPSTGMRIDAGKEALVRDDGWLEDQIKAGFLVKKT